jgi:hypothetical protein
LRSAVAGIEDKANTPVTASMRANCGDIGGELKALSGNAIPGLKRLKIGGEVLAKRIDDPGDGV